MAGVPERPLLKPWYRLGRSDGAIVLEYGHRAVVLSGRALERLVPALLPLLDGEHTVAEIVAELGGAAADAVHAALALLAERGLLTEGPAADHATADFLAATVPGAAAPHALRASVEATRIAVVGSSAAGARAARLLRQAGAEVLPGGLGRAPAECDLALVAPSGEELPGLAAWNDRALAAGRVWLQILPFDGRIAAVGPLVVPGETACGRCYDIRRQSCLGYGADGGALAGAAAYRPAPPALEAMAGGLAALVVLQWVAGAKTVAGRLLALALAPGPSLSEHVVYRVPRCPACSDADASAPLLPWFKEEAA